jgi:hypothetical protein
MKLNRKEYKHVRKNLPQLDLILNRDDNEGEYKKIIVSVFKRFMTREEFEVYNDFDFETLMARREKFETSITLLFNRTDCYLWRYRRTFKPYIFKPKSLKSFLNKCDIKNQTFRTGDHYDIIMPEFQAIYTREFDWTNIVWYRDESKIMDILKIIKESGLYVIN